MEMDHAAGRKLGRLPAKRDPRVPRFSAVVDPLPPAPARYTDYVESVGSWILGENDRIGDCTCVGPANVILGLTTLGGFPKRLADDAIVGFYEKVGGYVPGDESTDNGCMIEDVLAAWHASGFGGDRLDGYASIRPKDHAALREAIAFLAPVDLGINLPNGWMRASTWDVSTAGEGIAGGHCITAIGYTEEGLQIVSWGQVFTMTWAATDAFCDEAHALLSHDALLDAGKDVGGVRWTMLEDYIEQIREAA